MKKLDPPGKILVKKCQKVPKQAFLAVFGLFWQKSGFFAYFLQFFEIFPSNAYSDHLKFEKIRPDRFFLGSWKLLIRCLLSFPKWPFFFSILILKSLSFAHLISAKLVWKWAIISSSRAFILKRNLEISVSNCTYRML